MTTMDEEWFRAALDRYCRAKGLEKVEPEELSLAVPKGENYTSSVKRIKLKLTWKDGKQTTKSVVLKEEDESIMEHTPFGEMDMFQTEIKAYTKLIPKLEVIMNNGSDLLWPSYFGHRDFDRVLLEDLRECGYRVADRCKGLGKDECMLVMRGLAKLHAYSKILKDRGDIDSDLFPLYNFAGFTESNQKFLKFIFDIAANVINTVWSDDWAYYKKFLKKFPEVAIKKLQSVCDPEKAPFAVFNHGDSWTNNILFRYDEETMKPKSVRFVDFQLMNYGTYALDLQYFMITSVSCQTRNKGEEEMLKEYQNVLEETLKAFGETNVPSLEEIQKEMERTWIVGLMAALCVLPVFLGDSNKVFAQNPNDMSNEEIKQRMIIRYKSKTYSSALQEILVQYESKGYLAELFSEESNRI